MATAFYENALHGELIQDELVEELDGTLTRFCLSDLSEYPLASTPADEQDITNPRQVFLPAGPTAAYTWFLDNLYNPYPSRNVKAYLALSSGVSVKSVEAWFIKIRWEIGWTTLSRGSFSDSRAAMLHAAQLAYVHDDSEKSLSKRDRFAFAVVRENLERLPPSNRILRQCPQPGISDAASAPHTMDHGTSYGTGVAAIKGRAERSLTNGIAEPSTGSDPSVFPHLAVCASLDWMSAAPTDDELEEEDTTPTSSVAAFKHRTDDTFAPGSPFGQSIDNTLPRPIKRLRRDSIPSSETQLRLSVPRRPSALLSSVSGLPIEFPADPSSSIPTMSEFAGDGMADASTTLAPIKPHKGCFSDPCAPREPKCPHGLLQCARPHAVSNHLSAGTVEYDINSFMTDDWVELFSIAKPVSSDDFVPLATAPVDADILRDASFPDPEFDDSFGLLPSIGMEHQSQSQPASTEMQNTEDQALAVSHLDLLSSLPAVEPNFAVPAPASLPASALAYENTFSSFLQSQAESSEPSSAIDWDEFDIITKLCSPEVNIASTPDPDAVFPSLEDFLWGAN
ncbi:hypothetical protein EW146_g6649 [Bondarzewia mesenterica]|uniref:KN homeodomain domain-containing protein n=1 Tax=Bondarzewia mesenterica TaxID=1095465 RepID=A0A4S4LPT1_9AGAM|nr:hypothetical protein EW146_g6649 [Bondarzewia mesenterica]